MAKKIKYIDNDVIFNDVKEPGIVLPSVPISRNNNYTYNGEEDQITGIQFKTINSIDIDWNEAEVEEDIKISTTGQFINWINQKFRSIPDPPTWSTLSGKPNFATVATSGSYNDLTDKPNLFNGDYNSLTNKPTMPTVPSNVGAFTNDSGYITLSELEGALGNIDLTNNKTVKDYIDNSSSLATLKNRVEHLEDHTISLNKNEKRYLLTGTGSDSYDTIYVKGNIHDVEIEEGLDGKTVEVVSLDDGGIRVHALKVGKSTLTVTCGSFEKGASTYFIKIEYEVFERYWIEPEENDDGLSGYVTRTIEVNLTKYVSIHGGLSISQFRCNNGNISVTNNGSLTVTGVNTGETLIEITFFGNHPQKLFIKFIIGLETKVVGSTNRSLSAGSSPDTIEITGENDIYIVNAEISNTRVLPDYNLNPLSRSVQVNIGKMSSNGITRFSGGLSTVYLYCSNGKKLSVNYTISDSECLLNNTSYYHDSLNHAHYCYEINKTYKITIGAKATSCYLTYFDDPQSATIKKSTEKINDNYWYITPNRVGSGRLVIKGNPGFNMEIFIDFVEPDVYLSRNNIPVDLSPNYYETTILDENLDITYYYSHPNDILTLVIPSGASDDKITNVVSSNTNYLDVNSDDKHAYIIAPYTPSNYVHNVSVTITTKNGKTFLVDYKVYPNNYVSSNTLALLDGDTNDVGYIYRTGTAGTSLTIGITNDKAWYVCSDHPGVARPVVENGVTKVYLENPGSACVKIITAGQNRYGSSTFFVFFSVTENGLNLTFSIIGSKSRTIYPYVRDLILLNNGLVLSVASDEAVRGMIAYTEYIGESPWGYFPDGEYGGTQRNTLISYVWEPYLSDNNAVLTINSSYGSDNITYTVETDTSKIPFTYNAGRTPANTSPSPLNVLWSNVEVGFRCAPPYGSDKNPKAGQTSITEFTSSSNIQQPFYLIVNWGSKIGDLHLFYPIVQIKNNGIKVLVKKVLINDETEEVDAFMCYDYGKIVTSYVPLSNGYSDVVRGMCDFVKQTLKNTIGGTYTVDGVETVLDWHEVNQSTNGRLCMWMNDLCTIDYQSQSSINFPTVTVGGYLNIGDVSSSNS